MNQRRAVRQGRRVAGIIILIIVMRCAGVALSGLDAPMRRAVGTLLLLAWIAPAAGAQDTAPPARPPKQEPVQAAPASPQRSFVSSLIHHLGDDLKHMPRRNSLYWLAGGTAGALAIHPLDDNINERFVGSDVADSLFTPGKVLGSSPFIVGAATITYLVGRMNAQPRVRHLGMDLIESTILAEGITQVIKVIVRRDRPVHADGSSNPGYSFPSGHSTVTFAAATVLQQHLGWKAAVPTYLVATYVAMSRLHDNRHFASDVVFGATDGVIIGRSVTWHGRNFYAMPTVVPGGAAVMVSLGP
jgi:membrane-associated phospholipid phosphatase